MMKPSNRLPSVAALGGLALAILSLGACSKSDDASKPAGFPAQDKGSAAQPTPAAPAAPAAAPAVPTPAAPAPTPEPAAAEAKPDPNAVISGEIVLAPSVKAAVKSGDQIYLVARRISDNPTARGSLVAVKKFTADKFPIPFSLGPEDMMFKNGAFEGDLTLSARVDKDGDPMTRKKGDVIAALPKVHVGSRGVKLSLNTIQKEDESLAAPPMMGAGAASPHGSMPPGHP
jgi:hypothetical protein